MEARKERAKSEAEGGGEAESTSMSPGRRREAPYRRSEGAQAESSLTEVLKPNKTKGRCSIQLEDLVAQAREMSLSFKVRCWRSMRPLLCGW